MTRTNGKKVTTVTLTLDSEKSQVGKYSIDQEGGAILYLPKTWFGGKCPKKVAITAQEL